MHRHSACTPVARWSHEEAHAHLCVTRLGFCMIEISGRWANPNSHASLFENPRACSKANALVKRLGALTACLSARKTKLPCNDLIGQQLIEHHACTDIWWQRCYTRLALPSSITYALCVSIWTREHEIISALRTAIHSVRVPMNYSCTPSVLLFFLSQDNASRTKHPAPSWDGTRDEKK